MISLRRAACRATVSALLPALACDASAATRASDEVVSVRASSTELAIRNLSPWPVWTLAIERDAIAYTDFIVCTDAGRCDGIVPGSERRERLDRIIGYSAGREVMVVYQELVPAAAGGPARARSGAVTVRP